MCTSTEGRHQVAELQRPAAGFLRRVVSNRGCLGQFGQFGQGSKHANSSSFKGAAPPNMTIPARPFFSQNACTASRNTGPGGPACTGHTALHQAPAHPFHVFLRNSTAPALSLPPFPAQCSTDGDDFTFLTYFVLGSLHLCPSGLGLW